MPASLPGNGSAFASSYSGGINIAVRSAGSRAALNAIISSTWNRVAQHGRRIILPPIVARATQPTIKNLLHPATASAKPGRGWSLKCSIPEFWALLRLVVFCLQICTIRFKSPEIRLPNLMEVRT